jgi:hypothetical protein
VSPDSLLHFVGFCQLMRLCSHAITINNLIKDKYVPTMQNVEWEGKKYPPPQQIPW